MAVSLGWIERVETVAAATLAREDIAREVMPLLADGFGACAGLHYRIEPDATLSSAPGPEASWFLDAYNARYLGRDPLQVVKRRSERRVLVTSSLVDPVVLRRSEIYNELYAAADIEHHLVLRLTSRRYGLPGTECIVLGRTRFQESWDAEELRAAERVLPPLTAAARRARRWESMSSSVRALEALLDSIAQKPCILCSADGAIVWASRPAREALDRDKAGRVREELAHAARTFAELGAHGRRAASGAPDGRFVSKVRPDIAGELSFLGTPDGSFVLFLLDQLVMSSYLAARLASRYGLSPAEIRVACSLGKGLTNQQIARELFLSKETVRTHLGSIFRKLGVRSRTQAALEILKGGQDG